MKMPFIVKQNKEKIELLMDCMCKYVNIPKQKN